MNKISKVSKLNKSSKYTICDIVGDDIRTRSIFCKVSNDLIRYGCKESRYLIPIYLWLCFHSVFDEVEFTIGLLVDSIAPGKKNYGIYGEFKECVKWLIDEGFVEVCGDRENDDGDANDDRSEGSIGNNDRIVVKIYRDVEDYYTVVKYDEWNLLRVKCRGDFVGMIDLFCYIKMRVCVLENVGKGMFEGVGYITEQMWCGNNSVSKWVRMLGEVGLLG